MLNIVSFCGFFLIVGLCFQQEGDTSSSVLAFTLFITPTRLPSSRRNPHVAQQKQQNRIFIGSKSKPSSPTTSNNIIKLQRLRRPFDDDDLEALEQKTPTDREVLRYLDTYGERSRIYRRNVYTAGDWVRTRRPERFTENILTIFNSGLMKALNFELLFLTISTTFIVVWNDFFVYGWTDFSGTEHERFVNFLPPLQLPLAPFSLSVAALGLLLTFRTNVSYSRWNEARTAWGKVINDSRSIARMGCIWAKSYKNIDDAALQRLGEAICSFSRSLMNRTLPPQEDENDYRYYLSTMISDPEFASTLKNAKHRPTAALAEITSILVDFKLNPLHQVEVEKAVTGLCDALGASERIFTSPVPTFYTRHTARFLAFWLLTLPTALYETFGGTWNHWGVIPVTVVIAGFLLGIEELATQMEEPFSILPMEKMSEGSIRTPVMEQVERSKKGDQSGYYGGIKDIAADTSYSGRTYQLPRSEGTYQIPASPGATYTIPSSNPSKTHTIPRPSTTYSVPSASPVASSPTYTIPLDSSTVDVSTNSIVDNANDGTSHFSARGMSQEDLDKLSTYFMEDQKQTTASNKQQQSIEDLNKQWARQSGSMS